MIGGVGRGVAVNNRDAVPGDVDLGKERRGTVAVQSIGIEFERDEFVRSAHICVADIEVRRRVFVIADQPEGRARWGGARLEPSRAVRHRDARVARARASKQHLVSAIDQIRADEVPRRDAVKKVDLVVTDVEGDVERGGRARRAGPVHRQCRGGEKAHRGRPCAHAEHFKVVTRFIGVVRRHGDHRSGRANRVGVMGHRECRRPARCDRSGRVAHRERRVARRDVADRQSAQARVFYREGPGDRTGHGVGGPQDRMVGFAWRRVAVDDGRAIAGDVDLGRVRKRVGLVCGRLKRRQRIAGDVGDVRVRPDIDPNDAVDPGQITARHGQGIACIRACDDAGRRRPGDLEIVP